MEYYVIKYLGNTSHGVQCLQIDIRLLVHPQGILSRVLL